MATEPTLPVPARPHACACSSGPHAETAGAIAVPVEQLEALLTGWSALTAHYGRDAVAPEADDAYDVLNDLLADVLS